MGFSSTSADDLRTRSAYRATSNTKYEYSSKMHEAPPSARKVHESLDPKGLNSKGEKIRECRDSDAHPNALGVAVLFDETGSMGSGPMILQDKLAGLKGVTQRAGLDDVQLLFGAYGDAHNGEVAPCQIGQFESGLEMEDWLNNIFIEKMGGANGHETAGLALWFLGTYAALDSIEKRGKKGYIFLTGDETAGPVTRTEVQRYIGETIEADLTIEQVVEMASEKFEIFMMLVNNSSAHTQKSEAFWGNLLGKDHVVIVENLENIAELIGSVLAFEEDAVTDVDSIVGLVAAEGSTSKDLAIVTNTMNTYTSRRGNVVRTTDVQGAISLSNDAGMTAL
jgi:hypothetical protein